MKNSEVYLKHILDAINRIESFVDGVDFESFSDNQMMVSAVIRELEVIGEASNQIDPSFKTSHPDLPWKDMVGMRNFLIHEYFGVSSKIVWNTVKNNLPELKQKLEKMV